MSNKAGSRISKCITHAPDRKYSTNFLKKISTNKPFKELIKLYVVTYAGTACSSRTKLVGLSALENQYPSVNHHHGYNFELIVAAALIAWCIE